MLIAHASANLTENDIGFLHATAIAAALSGDRRMVTLHVPNDQPLHGPAQAKHWLTLWGLPADHVEQSFYSTCGYGDPPEELLEACRVIRPDLLVLPTHARTGLSRMLAGSVAEKVAHNASIPSLLLPFDGRQLVDKQTGQLSLERVLVLGGSQPDAQLGVDVASWMARQVGHAGARVTLLHVYDDSPVPETSHVPEVELRLERNAGELSDVVVMVCAELQPQLIVMVSRGHDQLRDRVLGSRTERVLRAAHRPLLWVPQTFEPRSDLLPRQNTPRSFRSDQR